MDGICVHQHLNSNVISLWVVTAETYQKERNIEIRGNLWHLDSFNMVKQIHVI